MCVATLCVGEIHATLTGKPHSEIFDATLGSLIGYAIGRASVVRSEKEKPPSQPPDPS